MKTLKVLHIQNGPIWQSMPDLLNRLKEKAKPFVTLDFTTIETRYFNIPFEPSGTGNKQVAVAWVKENIQPIVAKYGCDACIFTLPENQWLGGEDNAHTYQSLGLPIISVLHAYEGELLYNNPFYNAWYERVQHELLGHCFCTLTNVFDDSHFVEKNHRLDSPEALSRYNFNRYITITEQKDQIGLLQKSIEFLKNQIAAFQLRKASPLARALVQVESRGNIWAVGDLHIPQHAYGPLQIRQPCVDDVNKVKGTHYRAEDMLGDLSLSLEILDAYMDIHCKGFTDEQKARCWNGGPKGYMKDSTLVYWNNVKKYL